MADLDKVGDEGERSYFSNSGTFVCPYARDTPEFNSFERGWIQALKRDPNPILTSSPLSSNHTHAAASPPPERYNAYAELKGRPSSKR